MDEQRTLLVVEDEPELRAILSEILRAKWQNVFEACDGVQALEVLAKQPMSLVLSDIKMPNLNGLDLFAETRRLHGDVPFVFITAFGDTENIMKALRLGAFDFIKKPFDIVEVNSVIDRALEFGYRRSQVAHEISLCDADRQKAIKSHDKMSRLLQIKNTKSRVS